jgi:starvation-inducible DNA-binding protein
MKDVGTCEKPEGAGNQAVISGCPNGITPKKISVMTKLTQIGLDKAQSSSLADNLNHLLANYQVFYQSLRGLHWNIKGPHFFELHVKFEELYNDAQLKIDEVAERILTLGFTPLHTFSDYLAHAEVPIGKDISDATGAVTLVVDSLRAIVVIERNILAEAEALGDEGTLTLLTDFITLQEKMIWMYGSWLNK